MSTKRENGFYWVNVEGAWTIAEYDGKWWMVGCSQPTPDKALQAVGPQIQMPEELEDE